MKRKKSTSNLLVEWSGGAKTKTKWKWILGKTSEKEKNIHPFLLIEAKIFIYYYSAYARVLCEWANETEDECEAPYGTGCEPFQE